MNNFREISRGIPSPEWLQWDEIATCMKCGREAILLESRDGDGAHACKFGCMGPTGLEEKPEEENTRWEEDE